MAAPKQIVIKKGCVAAPKQLSDNPGVWQLLSSLVIIQVCVAAPQQIVTIQGCVAVPKQFRDNPGVCKGS